MIWPQATVAASTRVCTTVAISGATTADAIEIAAHCATQVRSRDVIPRIESIERRPQTRSPATCRSLSSYGVQFASTVTPEKPAGMSIVPIAIDWFSVPVSGPVEALIRPTDSL